MSPASFAAPASNAGWFRAPSPTSPTSCRRSPISPERRCRRTKPSTATAWRPCCAARRQQHRDWIYSHLDDGRVLRDSRWLLEIAKGGKGEQFFDCGESRDGTGYKDVTHSTDPEVKAARARFAGILASMPEPKPRPGAKQPAGKAQRKGKGKAE